MDPGMQGILRCIGFVIDNIEKLKEKSRYL